MARSWVQILGSWALGSKVPTSIWWNKEASPGGQEADNTLLKPVVGYDSDTLPVESSGVLKSRPTDQCRPPQLLLPVTFFKLQKPRCPGAKTRFLSLEQLRIVAQWKLSRNNWELDLTVDKFHFKCMLFLKKKSFILERFKRSFSVLILRQDA